ncbi:MAG: hypothetical protein QOI24_1067 [Acidobacteriota bacterium]|nr:hypothetical protein [Acidobacteriota bacterium]
MTFYVQRQLATGPIRFGVSPRKPSESIDDDTSLSTGASGEFIRHRELFFSADTLRVGEAVLPKSASISSTPFLSSLKPDGTPRGYGFLALMIAGALLVLLGFGVVANKGSQGWVEVILGVIMIAVPIVLTAQRRKQLHEQEERERAEREATEKRNREMLAAYSSALERARHDPSSATLDELRRERAALTLSYEIWRAVARQTILRIGFEALAKLSPAGAAEVAKRMDEASEAAGLNEEDRIEVKRDLYRVALWHLLADDRLGATQDEQLSAIRGGFGIADADVPADLGAVSEFLRLRGIAPATLPRRDCRVKLAFQEFCIHETTGATMKFARAKKKSATPGRWVKERDCTLTITSRRLIITTNKQTELPLSFVDDVMVNVDTNVMTIHTGNVKKPIHLQVADPIYTANLIDIAAGIDPRPKGFA